MCDINCNCKNKGNGNIALVFNQNKLPIASVFTKYSMGHMEPTPENALIGAKAFGYNFIKELALAASGANPAISNYTSAESATLAAQIFQIFGMAADTGVNIAQGIADIKNGNAAPNQPNNAGQTAVYMPTPDKPENRIAGFTKNQVGLLLLAGALVISVLIYFNKQGAKG